MIVNSGANEAKAKFHRSESMVLLILGGATSAALISVAGLFFSFWSGSLPLIVGCIAGGLGGATTSFFTNDKKSELAITNLVAARALAEDASHMELYQILDEPSDVSAKLKMAESYITMGDIEAAHVILVEVLEQEVEISHRLESSEPDLRDLTRN